MEYLFLSLALLIIPSALAGLSAAPYVPTKKRDVARFLKLAEISSKGGSPPKADTAPRLPASGGGGKKEKIVYDLGCGDGRLLVAAAKNGAKAIGYEMSLLNYLFCLLFRRGIKVKLRDFFNADFCDADVAYMFLSQKAHNKMGEILARQMKKGSRIICYVWPIVGMAAQRIDKEAGRPDMYLYVIN